MYTLRENDQVGDFDLIKINSYGNLQYKYDPLITEI